MDRETPQDREQQLNELRERTQSEESYRKSERYLEKQRDRNFEKARAVLMGVVLFLCAAVLGMLFVHNYKYTTYRVDSETRLSQGKTAKMFAFKNGSIIVSGDSVSYIVGEKQEFSVPLSLKQPGFSTAGSFFTLYSEGAYEGYLFSESGLMSTVKTETPIRGMRCATTGVTVVMTDSGEASQLTYYQKNGAPLSVTVQATMGKTGYPLAFAVSPDGQKLAVCYYSLQSGLGESNLFVYDFRNGKADENYVCASDSSFGETDTFLADVYFTDNDHLTAVGDNCLYFYRMQDMASPVKAELTGRVCSVKQIGADTLLVYRNSDGTQCSRYTKDGKLKHSFRCVAEYDHITANEHYVLFWSDADITFYNASGVYRYFGTLPSAPLSISFTGSRSLLLNNGETLQKITLK